MPAGGLLVPNLWIVFRLIGEGGAVVIVGGVGSGLTVTVVVYTVAGLQPDTFVLTVNEYMLVILGETFGFCNVELYPPGPLHAYNIAPVPPTALDCSVAVSPKHIGLVFDGLAVGTELTITVVVYTVAG